MKHLVALACLLFACNASGLSVSSTSRAAALTGDTLAAILGPEGGELRGEKGSAFEGFALILPKGALRERTEIVVHREAPAGLPVDAAPLSTMFVIEPRLHLEVSAQLTLPVDPGRYEFLGGREQTPVVYGLDDRLVIPNRAVADAVQIETLIDDIGPVIPALDIELRTPACVRNRTCLQSCGRESFCVVHLGNVGRPSLVFESAVAANGLYWLDNNEPGRAFRFDLTTGVTTASEPASSSEIARGPVAAQDGALWAAGEHGTTRYSFSQTTQGFDADLIGEQTRAVAPVTLADGSVLRAYFSLGEFDPDFNLEPVLPHSTIRSAAGTFETRRATAQQTEIMPHFGDARRFFSPGFELLGALTNPGLAPRLLELDVEGRVISKEEIPLQFVSILSARPFFQSNRVGTEVGVRSADRLITVCRYLDDVHGCPDSITLNADDGIIRDFSLDRLGGAWIAPFGSTEIIFTKSSGSPQLLRHDFAQDLPDVEVGSIQQVHSIGVRQAVALTSNGDVFFIRYQD